jgi:hypothetical protein
LIGWLVMWCLNTTFNNISVISWRTQRKPSVTDKLYHIMLYTSTWSRFKLTTSVAIGTDCIGSCNSNYHRITATMTPRNIDISSSTDPLTLVWLEIFHWQFKSLSQFAILRLKYCKLKNLITLDIHAHWNYFSMIPYHMYVLFFNTKCCIVHISNLDRTKYVFKQFIIN